MPAEILTYWQAFFSADAEPKKEESKVIAHDDISSQYNEVMRVLNG